MAESSVILVTLDPGEQSGLAMGRYAGPLAWCGLNELPPLPHGVVYDLFWEKPVIQMQGQTRGKDPNALITEAVTAGEWLERIRTRLGPPRREWFSYPSAWKGSAPKEIHNARVLEKLSPGERDVLEACRTRGARPIPASKLHNVVDGIGLWCVGTGRMGRGR
jgi:hypothetical protein